MNEYSAPTTREEAYNLIAPLDPRYPELTTGEEKETAYLRLVDLLWMLFPEEK